jgi:50S ribosomal protein L16 3-hydroxylase
MNSNRTSSFSLEVRATRNRPLGMPPARFLRDYWQQRPLLIRSAPAEFRAPLSPEDLAGLACEELALARLVTHEPRRDRWSVRSGPFSESDFAGLPKSHWTLLVQDVDKWDADVASLLDPFGFLPRWRVDDVMVSYAVDGGSVGAHVDQYDVFLLQGQGRRRWQISTDPHARMDFRADVELKLLREFTPTHDWLLEPGDMLYLPPGIAHHGVAQGACMTFSIGMRAPAVSEMIADFAGFLAERMDESARYTDSGIAPAKMAGEIDAASLVRVEQMLRDSLAVDASLLRCWFGSFITRYRAAHEVLPRARPLGAAALMRRLRNGGTLQVNPWSRMAWMRDGPRTLLFVAGEALPCPQRLAIALCRRKAFALSAAGEPDAATLELLLNLLNDGHLAFGRPRSKT